MLDIEDGIESGRLSNDSIQSQKLKSGHVSITDPALCRMQLRSYLLGAWLDGLDVPASIKSKCREVFASHATYRTSFNPLVSDVVLDTTWLFSLPKYGRDLLEFLEHILYVPNGSNDFTLRMAVKNNNTNEEVLTNRPWCVNLRHSGNIYGMKCKCDEHFWKPWECMGRLSFPRSL